MEQLTMLSQYNIDRGNFIESLSNFTGISKAKLSNFLDHNSINTIFEHSTALDITNAQREKLYRLKELKNLYQNLKSHDKDYVMNSSTKAGEYFKNYFSGAKDKEYFVCSFLDNRNRIIATKVITTGTVNEAPVYPREIAKTALLYDTSSVMLSHNHPGGSLTPSQPDINVTGLIANALSLVNIKIMDHIIVGDDKFSSFVEKGYSLSPTQTIAEPSDKYNIVEKIKSHYSKEMPAIKYISQETAALIDTLNKAIDHTLTIKDIYNLYDQAGKKLEINTTNNEIALNGTNFTRNELINKVKDYITSLKISNELEGLEFEIIAADIYGSRIKKYEHSDSDLDIVIEYKGTAREDSLFNALNREPLKINGIKVDINPITADKTGTLKDFLSAADQYSDKRILQDFNALSNVIEDLKQSKLLFNQEQAHEKAMQNQISKSNAMDMIQ